MKSAGQIAYEEDRVRCPVLADGSERPSWNELPQVMRWTWNGGRLDHVGFTDTAEERDEPFSFTMMLACAGLGLAIAYALGPVMPFAVLASY